MRHDVMIIGAGPTGLVLALWLNAMGVSVRIVSKAAGPGTASRALAVHARTLELYEQMGLTDAVQAEGHQVRGVNVWVGGERRVRVPLDGLGKGQTRYPFLYIYPQDRHEELLVSRLEAAGVPIEWNTTFNGYEEEPDGVTVRLTLPDGNEEVAEARYLAGCDGASSAVRKALGVGFPGGTYQQTFYVADIEADGPPMNGELNLALDTSDFLAVFPLDEGRRARLVGTVEEDEEHVGQLRFEDLNDAAVQHLRIDVKSVAWFSTYRVHHRVTERFGKGRAFLLGDAAHIHSPAGGQGMNTGIGDAINLAWKLRSVLQGEMSAQAADRLLSSYEEERMAFARRLVRTTDQMFSLATANGAVPAFMRARIVPLVLPVLVRLPLLRQFIFRTVSQIGIHYRGDTLSEGRAGRVHGGDRLPWVETGDGRSKHDGLNEMRWQVQVFGEAPRVLADWCKTNGLPLRTFAWTPGAERAGFVRDAIYLVRPDGYLGCVASGDATSVLQDYFGTRGFKLPLV
jgi:2-polyprenyl-6-methoxyphenol hydroxylase and related FAD-dependent oxidoreductases